MSTQPPEVKQFILDATETAMRLDGMTTRYDREAFSLVLSSGQADYEALLKRRETLPLLRSDAAVVDFVLDGIKARLKFLQKYRSRSLPN